MRMDNAEKIRKAMDISLEDIARKMGYHRLELDTSEYTGVYSNGEMDCVEIDDVMDIVASML